MALFESEEDEMARALSRVDINNSDRSKKKNGSGAKGSSQAESLTVATAFATALMVKAKLRAADVSATITAARAERRGKCGPGGGASGSTSSGDDSGLVPPSMLRPFLDPDYNAAYVAPSPSSTTTRYLAAVKGQILAEFAGFLESAFVKPFVLLLNDDSKFSVRNEHEDWDVDFRGSALDHTKAMTYRGVRDLGEPKAEMESGEFHQCLAVYRGALVLLRCDSESTRLCLLSRGAPWRGRRLPSSSLPRDWPEDELPASKDLLLVIGYCGDHLAQYAAVHAFEMGTLPPPKLLAATADPTKRRAAAYASRKVDRHSVVPLNKRQHQVLSNLSTNIEGIQGPPGTGKSTVIYHLCQSFLDEDEVALATCVQNKAVDAIAEKLATTETVPFFVVGNVNRLGALAARWTVEAQVERDGHVQALNRVLGTVHRCAQRIGKTEKVFNDDASSSSSSSRDGRAMWRAKLAELNRRVSSDEYNLTQELEATRSAVTVAVIAAARVVLCTIATASKSLLVNPALAPALGRITTAILDEAGTCAEPNVPLLLLLPRLDRIVAIGDQKQLAPFSNISQQKKPGSRGEGGACYAFQRSGTCRNGRSCRFTHEERRRDSRPPPPAAEPAGFFQRLERALPRGSVPLLIDQYRMHPAIASYIGKSFYGGQLNTPVAVAATRRRGDARGMYLVTYPTGPNGAEDAPEPGRRQGTSKSNSKEVRLVFDVVKAQPRSKQSILVITFYKAQEVALREYFEKGGITEQAGDGLPGTSKGGTLRICSVDQAQGSEAALVVLSCVRSNDRADVGFLKSPNRLNVAVSRARERLVLVGDANTLRAGGGKQWKDLVDACHPATVATIPVSPPHHSERP